MSKKELESHIAKYLRKANRLKTTQAKLECINALMASIRGLLVGSGSDVSANPPETIQQSDDLEQYLEICHVHKIKFQMDAILADANNEIGWLKRNPGQITYEKFASLKHRLQVVLDMDVAHPEARALLDTLQGEYKQYVQEDDLSGINLSIGQYQSPKLRIDLTCTLQDVNSRDQLKNLYKQYQVTTKRQSHAGNPASADNTSLCRMRFSLDHLKDFELFHEELRIRSSYKIAVNNYTLEEQAFTEWFQCYKRFLKANNPQYCYGGSPLTFNVFGCHKLNLQDVAKQVEQCWFHAGTLEQDSGLFLVNKKPIAEQIQTRLRYCGFCPALTQAKLTLGLSLIPGYINPECDSRWVYLCFQGRKIGVLPSGNEMAIALPQTNSSSTEPFTYIEVGSTPYIFKAVQYLHSHDPIDLGESAYRGLSTCVLCGAPYKRHTMKCSKCKMEFWKSAFKAPEQVFERLRYVKLIKLQPLAVENQGVYLENQPLVPDMSEGIVSFERLWSDPQIQAMLSDERQGVERPRVKQEKQEKVPIKPQVSKRKSKASTPLDLPEKIKGLVSKKYRERKAIEHAFSQPTQQKKQPEPALGKDERAEALRSPSEFASQLRSTSSMKQDHADMSSAVSPAVSPERTALINAVRSLKLKQKSDLSKRGVVRVIYHATMDKETCPLCNYLDGMVMDPDDPATEIFSPPLYSGCTCRREYVLKTEKPKNWPKVTFVFPPDDLLIYLKKQDKDS
jgi:hypothetical protein